MAAAAHGRLRIQRSMRDLHEVRHQREVHHNHLIWSFKVQVYEAYHSRPAQLFVAGLIMSNFVLECLQRQVDPHAENHPRIWSGLEDFFCIAFLVELLVNMYGSWRKPFFRIGWNYFDMFVVAIGILILVRCPMPGPLSLVLMLRTLRVFRIFGRIESLKRILRLIAMSLPYHLNACLIMLIVICIYSVLAVDLYAEYDVVINHADPDNPDITARGETYSKDYYGTYFKAMYTLFQLLTGESWSEMGVRPILEASPNILSNFGNALFFTSFVLIGSVVLLNVVVAVLLNGMAEASSSEDDDLVEWDPGPEETENDRVVEPDGDDDKHGNNHNNDKDIPDNDEEDDVISKDMAALKKQVDTMSAEINDVLSGLRLLEAQR